MNFTRRELTLALATGLVVLIGLTYWIVSNKLPTIRDADKERQLIERKIEVNKRLIRKQKPLMARLNSIINTLPQHDKDKDVQYELLQEISQQAGNTQFNIIRRIPGDERKVGNTELYELSIDCTYESTLEPLVYFLYNLQAKGAVMNVSELQVKQASTRPDRKGQLKGSFLVDFAYSRIDYTAEPAARAVPPSPAPAPTPTPTNPVTAAPANPNPAEPAPTTAPRSGVIPLPSATRHAQDDPSALAPTQGRTANTGPTLPPPNANSPARPSLPSPPRLTPPSPQK